MRPYLGTKRQSRRAFTLIELLVVLAIIGLLTAILFPIFKSARERSYQTHCTTNLRQISVALLLYKQDEKEYPGSLGALLPNNAFLANYDNQSTNVDGAACDNTKDTCPNTSGTGYLKTTKDILVCNDDPTEDQYPRSSYGDISTGLYAGPSLPNSTVGPALEVDYGRHVWNYFGYNAVGVAAANGVTAASINAAGRVDPGSAYDGDTNPIKYSLSYRYAPPETIVTHCVYHRLPTARRVDRPELLYDNSSDPKDARDIVLRLDGSVRSLDVTGFATNRGSGLTTWQEPIF